MPYLAIDKNGNEWIYEQAEDRCHCHHGCPVKYNFIPLKKGMIELVIGRELQQWNDPVFFNTAHITP